MCRIKKSVHSKFRLVACISLLLCYRAGNTGGPRGHDPPPVPLFSFCVAKRKKGNKGKKETFKAETIKRLSLMSKCHCFSHSRASRIQKFFLVADNTFQCSMAPPL